MNKIIVSIAVLLLSAVTAFAQVKVKGKVTDGRDGSPLSGITIRVKGTKQGVSTNSDGTFSLDVPNNNTTLEFTGIGFVAKTVNARGDQEMNVILEQDAKNLNEVVVTALGIRRTRNSLAYAAQQVTGDEVSKTRGSNFVRDRKSVV